MALLTSAQGALAGSKDKDSWKAELEPALEKMDLFFSQVRASGMLKTTTKLKGMRNMLAEESLQTSGGAFKFARKLIEPKPRIAEIVYCRNPDRYVFHLERPEGNSSFVLKDFGPKTSPNTEVYDLLPQRFVRVSHYVQGIPLTTILTDRSFMVKSISVEEDVTKLSFTWSPSVELMPNLAFGSAELWLSVSKGWAIERYRIPLGQRDGKASVIDGVVDYDRMEKGVAIPKRIFEVHGSSATVEFVFDKIENCVADKRDFTLSYYDLPEPMGMSPVNQRSAWWLWFMGLGLTALMGAAWWFRRVRRLKIKTTPGEKVADHGAAL